MKDNTAKLTEKDVLAQAHQSLAQHVTLKADGYVCTTEQLFHILLGVAATKNSLEAVCADLQTAACAATIRGYFNEHLQVEELPNLESSRGRGVAREHSAGGFHS